ncbi:MAG: hypothetical protein WC244_04075 [Patescibacteria group bacterium]|jgi:orotate phosphoribosyltransferase
MVNKGILAIPHECATDPLEALRRLGGYYACPKDTQGNRIGPLVGYAGKDSKGVQMVGEIYANFAKMEEWPFILKHYLYLLVKEKLGGLEIDCVCGAPLGGLASATLLSARLCCRYAFPEKIVTKAKEEGKREEAHFAFSRHGIIKGERVVIFEDVVNNFTSTDDLIRLITSAGGIVIGIVALLNRSPFVDSVYTSKLDGVKLPVISLVRKQIDEWTQDDQFVADDIAKGNLVTKPKNDWDPLMKAMNLAA